MSKPKLKVAILMGGPTSEHEVSLNTGRMVLRALDKAKYQALPVIVSKSGRWPISPQALKDKIDVAFIAMHGEYGEDGTLQAILAAHKIPFTGSGIEASQLGMDKPRSLVSFEHAGLNVPRFIAARKTFIKFPFSFPDNFFPLVVKPADRGSSVGIAIAKNHNQLESALKTSLRYSPTAMIQEYINGREFTCGVLEKSGRPIALMPTEIIPKTRSFFDYHSKYVKDASQEITPPRLPKNKISELQAIAVRAHRIIGAGGLSRTDVILGLDNKFYVLEINTIPGLTETSLLPQGAAAAGIPFPRLLDLIIHAALN